MQFEHIKYEIFNYWNNCCRILKRLFQSLELIKKDKGIYSWVDTWDALPLYRNENDEKERFISILKDRLNLKWLNAEVKIEKVDEYTITISKNNRVL